MAAAFNYMSLFSMRFGNRLSEFKLRLSLGGTFGEYATITFVVLSCICRTLRENPADVVKEE